MCANAHRRFHQKLTTRTFANTYMYREIYLCWMCFVCIKLPIYRVCAVFCVYTNYICEYLTKHSIHIPKNNTTSLLSLFAFSSLLPFWMGYVQFDLLFISIFVLSAHGPMCQLYLLYSKINCIAKYWNYTNFCKLSPAVDLFICWLLRLYFMIIHVVLDGLLEVFFSSFIQHFV